MIERCDHYIGDSGVAHQFSATARERLETLKNEWSAQGRRVLLLARKVISRSTLKSSPLSSQFESEMFEHAKSGLTLVGLVAIVDPPRPEIPDVIKTLREAGIRIFMVCFRLEPSCLALRPNLSCLKGHWRLRPHRPGHSHRMRNHHQSKSSHCRHFCSVANA